MTTSRQPAALSDEPSDRIGYWQKEQHVYFWHSGNPFEVMHIIGKFTGILLHRDTNSARLTYQGSNCSGGNPRSIRLRHEAVIDSRNLYSFQMESRAPKKWTPEDRFEADADWTFEFWCAKLELASEIAWSDASAQLLAQRRCESMTLEDEETNIVEDSARIATLQHAILDSLRNGKRIYSASKEGVTQFTFDGSVFRRTDVGEEPNKNEVYATDDAMLACLHRFFQSDAPRPAYPRRPNEIVVWTHIQAQLKAPK